MIEYIKELSLLELDLIVVFGIIYYLFNELEDESVRNTWKKHKQFLNTGSSWKNKWKLDKDGHLIPNTYKYWYYFTIDPPYKERFYLSSTVLVFITDGEHLFQFIKNRAIEAAMLVCGWQVFVAWVIGKTIMSIIKEKFIKFLH